MTRETGAEDAHTASTQPDSELLAAIERGEQEAMAHLFVRYSKLVFSVGFRVLRDRSAAEDVMQEVFLQLWRTPLSFTAARGSLGAYLAVIARNRSIDLIRRRRPMDSVEDVALASPYDMAGGAERNLMIERVRVMMKELPEEQSKALEMAFFDGCTHSEIAEMTGIPLGTVKTRVRSALHLLGKALRA